MRNLALLASLAAALLLANTFGTVSTHASIPTEYTQTISSGPGIGSPNNRPFVVSFTFTGVPPLVGDGLLTVTATGDIGGGVDQFTGVGENIRVDAYNGSVLGYVFGDNVTGAEPVTLTDSIVISPSAWNAARQGDSVTLTFVVDSQFGTANAIFNSLTLSGPVETSLTDAEPDLFPEGDSLENAFPGVTLSVVNRPDATVIGVDGYNPGPWFERNIATTGTLVFGYTPGSGGQIPQPYVWDDGVYGNLRVDFDAPTDYVQVDLIHGDDGIAILRAYDAAGNLLQQIRAPGDGRGLSSSFCSQDGGFNRGFCAPVITASIERSSPDIAYVVTGGEGGEPALLDNFRYKLYPAVLHVDIDTKPGSDPNCLNINDHGVIPVAILGSADFDVTTVNAATLSFAGLAPREKNNGQLSCSHEDVNIDGHPDLVCQFEDNSANWAPDSDTEATLTGELNDTTPITGTDSICLVPANGPPVNGEQPPLDPTPWW